MSIVAALIAMAAVSEGVPPQTLLAICWTETKHETIVSANDGGSASYGICQVKLATARDHAPKVRVSDLLNPQTNAILAARVLRRQLDRYNGNLDCAVIAYNRGRASCDGYNARPTNRYLRRVKAAIAARPWGLQ